MTTETITLQALAQQAYDAMERATRDDGSVYYRKRDDAPEWVADVIHEAHADYMPDDWRYQTIYDALDAIANNDKPEEGRLAFADDADIYNADLLKWVSSQDRGGYVDEAREELGEPRDFYHSIQMGQYVERGEVYDLVLGALAQRAGDLDDEDQD